MDFVEARELRKRYHEASKAIASVERCLRYCNESKREYWEQEFEKCAAELATVESKIFQEMLVHFREMLIQPGETS